MNRKIQIHKLINGYLITLIFSWLTWCFVDLNNYRLLSGTELSNIIFQDFLGTLIESLCLFLFSLLSSKMIVKSLWHHRDNKRYLVGVILLQLILNLIYVIGIALFYRLSYPIERYNFYQVIITDFIVISVLSVTFIVLYFADKNREEENEIQRIKEEAKKKEIIELHTRLDTLAIQANNHFVFNCFSTVAGLIRKDPDSAESFVFALSEMYRYLTSNSRNHIVSVRDELDFVNHYAKVLSCQYSGIQINISQELQSLQAYVPPASVQILIENAVKHNSHGKNHKLSIDINYVNDSIVVSNNILKRNERVTGTHSGLKNLKDRYLLLTNNEPQIENTCILLKVSLPLIYKKDLNYKNTDNRR